MSCGLFWTAEFAEHAERKMKKLARRNNYHRSVEQHVVAIPIRVVTMTALIETVFLTTDLLEQQSRNQSLTTDSTDFHWWDTTNYFGSIRVQGEGVASLIVLSFQKEPAFSFSRSSALS